MLIDWLDVAAFLNEGAKRAKAEADGNDKSKAYKLAYSRWLKAHPELEAVSSPERAAALWCLKPENWPNARDYLHTLTPSQLAKVTMRTVKRHVEPSKDQDAPKAPKKETKTEALLRENEALSKQLAQKSRPAFDLNRPRVSRQGYARRCAEVAPGGHQRRARRARPKSRNRRRC